MARGELNWDLLIYVIKEISHYNMVLVIDLWKVT